MLAISPNGLCSKAPIISCVSESVDSTSFKGELFLKLRPVDKQRNSLVKEQHSRADGHRRNECTLGLTL